jgi:3-deoxy-D-manno-octulosonate 8-phosphate phosphatase (KDO 8-P phosphatase)
VTVSGDVLSARARALRLLLFDVDGVLTDGTVEISSDGSESKRFGIRDGLSLKWAQREGLAIGLVSGRASAATSRRAAELDIQIVVQGVPDKRAAFEEVLRANDVPAEHAAFMGDDLVDLPAMTAAGLSAAPADAVAEVLASADWISRHPGGRGAVREFIEFVLRARGRWTPVVDGYRT